MRRALVLALALAACATPAPPLEAPAFDPLAFIEPQASLPLTVFQNTHIENEIIAVIDPPITAICRDQWVSYSQTRSGTCSGHGGVAEWVNRPES